MARMSLVPQKREFFELYNRAAENAVTIAQRVIDLLDRFPEDADRMAREVKELEHEGDRLTHEIVDLVNRTFVTPFDRDDIYRLGAALDDICDNVDEAADNLGSYGASRVPPRAREQADVILQAAIQLDEAVGHLDGFKDPSTELAALRRLEDEGDRLLSDAVGELFRNESDAVTIIRWKDIHEQIEEANDACENAADVLEAILVRNR